MEENNMIVYIIILIGTIIFFVVFFYMNSYDIKFTNYKEVEVTVIGKNYQNSHSTPKGGHVPERCYICIYYDEQEYYINNKQTYEKFKNKIGEKAIGILRIDILKNNSINKNFIALK